MTVSIFDLFDLISLGTFPSSFKQACGTNGIHEGASIWLHYFFMKKQATALLNSKIALKSQPSRKCQEEGTLITY